MSRNGVWQMNWQDNEADESELLIYIRQRNTSTAPLSTDLTLLLLSEGKSDLSFAVYSVGSE